MAGPLTFAEWASQKKPDMVHLLPSLPFHSWLQQKGHIPAGVKKEEPKRPEDLWCPSGYIVLKDGSFVPECKSLKKS